MKHLKQDRGGFTLIELLLVMAIIGILAAAVIVGIGNQRERARVTSALQTVKSAMGPIMDCHLSENAYAGSHSTNVGNGGKFCSSLPATFSMPEGYTNLRIYHIRYGNAGYRGHVMIHGGELGSSWTTRVACQYNGNQAGSCKICAGTNTARSCVQQ